MTDLIVCVLITISLVATLVAAATREIEKLLWGTILCSLGLGVSVLVSGGGYFGVLMITTFLVTDLLLYLYFRSLWVYPKKKMLNKTVDRTIRIFMLWVGLCGFALAATTLLIFIEGSSFEGDRPQVVALLQSRVWGEDWYVIILTTLIMALITFGGFFLVRREKK